MRLALSALCENPKRKTGLTSMFRELVVHGRREFPEVEWNLFLPRDYEWEGMEGVHADWIDVDSGDLAKRLTADHFYVPVAARRRNCNALITAGFLPRLCPLAGIVHINTLHHEDKANQTGWLRAGYRRRETTRALLKADLVITNSMVAAQGLMDLEPAVKDRLLISHEGVQHEIFHPEAETNEVERLGQALSLEPGYVLWVSNLYPYKQIDLLLHAYSGLTEAERNAHPLVIVGRDWQGSLALAKQMAEDLGISRNLRFLGWVADEWIAPLHRQSAIHVLASREETFGRSVLEAMACGIPCVVNDIPIMREVTAGASILTDFTNREASNAALRRGLTDTTAIEDLRRRGIARAKDFSMRKLARERVTAILERLS
jgi:glycosyltransferase involved in cell wall biosynthesis